MMASSGAVPDWAFYEGIIIVFVVAHQNPPPPPCVPKDLNVILDDRIGSWSELDIKADCTQVSRQLWVDITV